MPISWNEIRHNAIKFSREWAGVKSESAEKQTFWNEFFQVFGIKRRVVASFEESVKKISGDFGRIDLFWPGIMLVEHKSFGEDLHKAETQAFQYICELASDPKRRDEIPRYIIVSDFARIAIHDLEPEEQRDLPLFDQKRGVTHVFPLAEFHKHVQHFAFIPGYKQHTLQEQDPINIEAVQIMGELHDALEAGGYTGHDLERFLVRVLFCLFAEDTGIFERESFHLFIENKTKPDGSDLGTMLARLFEILNTPPEKRQTNLDETLTAFPYVNGDLFSEHLGFADFNRDIRGIEGIKKRVDAVREFRLASKKVPTRKMAEQPSVFAEIRQPASRFMVVPQHTSETRRYVPFGYFDPKNIVHNSCSAIPNATLFHLGVLSSALHMAWVRQVCGRLESRYRYSTRLVYNNFPWPNASAEQRDRVEEKARAVLAAREPHLPPRGMATLADLYDPLAMPPALLKAHTELDRAVEKCYRPEPFHSDRERVEFLFSLYEKLTAPLLPATHAPKSPSTKSAATPSKPRKHRTPRLPSQQ